MTDEPCEHASFLVHGHVTCLTDTEDGPVTGHRLDVTVRCTDCDTQFVFPNSSPIGYSDWCATVSTDFLELRIPIRPPESGSAI